MARTPTEDTGSSRPPWLAGRAIWALVGAAVSVGFVALAARRLDWRAVGEGFRSAHAWPWVPLGAALYLAGHVVRGVRCRRLASLQSNLSTTTASNIVVVGYAVNNLLPARMGELARSGMLAERTGMPLVQALTVTFLERVLDGVIILAYFLGVGLFVPLAGWLRSTAEIGCVVFGVASLGLVVTIAFPQTVIAFASRAAAHGPARLYDPIVAVATNVTSGVAYLRRPLAAASALALTAIVWALEAGMFLLLLRAFDLPMRPSWALLAMTVTNLGILVPSSPGFIGPFHFFCAQSLVYLGVPSATALTYAIWVHLTFFVPVTAWGGTAISWYGVQLGKTMELARRARDLPSLPDAMIGAKSVARVHREVRSVETIRFVRALAESVIPWDLVALDARDRAKVLDDVGTFASESIAALPARLALLFGVGMFGFRFVVRAQTLRGFCDLSVDRRAKIVERWAWGPIGLTRQLFRVVRSTVLLGFYDHALVLAALASRGSGSRRLAIAQPREAAP